ncbi:MAG: YggT family protein [Burkholderiaceae bacterium]
MGNTVWFLLETVGQLLATACLLRSYMHWLGIAQRDPIGHFVIAVTDWIVKPLRRIMPTTRRIDWSSLLAALVISVTMAVAFVFLAGLSAAPVFGALVLTAVAWLIKWSVFLLIIVVIAHAVLSWVNPHAPIGPTLDALSRPFLAPIRRIVPLVGGVDLSPLVLIIGLQVVLAFIQNTVGRYLIG